MVFDEVPGGGSPASSSLWPILTLFETFRESQLNIVRMLLDEATVDGDLVASRHGMSSL